MEKYRKFLIIRCVGGILFTVLLTVLWQVTVWYPVPIDFGRAVSQYAHDSFPNAIAMVIGLAIGNFVKTYRVLQDDAFERKPLKKYYEEQHEERNMLINQKASSYTIFIVLILILIAQVVLRPSNPAVSFTLDLVFYAILIVFILLQLFFSHKY